MRSWKDRMNWLQQTPRKLQSKTLVEMLGKERLVIEGHRGICCYGTDEIRVWATFGQVRIIGSGMNLCCMSREQLCITGRIDAVELIGRSDSGALE